MSRYPYLTLLFCILLLASLAACRAASPFESKEYNPVVVHLYNHTTGSITWGTVNGLGVSGETCCVMLPIKWRPGLKARVEWEMDPNPYEPLKRTPGGGGATDPDAWKAHEAKFKRYQAVADIPAYPDNQTCGLQIHFFPCGRIKATATCIFYRDSAYPIQEPYDQPEPKSCPAPTQASPQ